MGSSSISRQCRASLPGVTVADRLQSPKGLKRRCERYLKEARKDPETDEGVAGLGPELCSF